MNGVAIILMGFISFGVLHTHTKNFKPWQWQVLLHACFITVSDISLKADDHHGYLDLFDFNRILVSLSPRPAGAHFERLHRFLFPDSPVNARFLTPEERIIAVSRLKVNQTGVENKTFKRSQMIAALKDPKTWLFFFFAGFS
jgi:ACS family allantoate permease-like MFS transporter